MRGQQQAIPAEKLPEVLAALQDNSSCANKNIPIEKMKALREQGLSYPQIGKLLGCSHINVLNRLKGYDIQHEDVKGYIDNRADILADMQWKLLSSITPDDIKKTPTGSRILAVAQLYDKERLERGLSTSNIDSHVVTAKIEQVKADLDRIHKRRMELQGVKNDNE
jgi:biotin operon repressor